MRFLKLDFRHRRRAPTSQQPPPEPSLPPPPNKNRLYSSKSYSTLSTVPSTSSLGGEGIEPLCSQPTNNKPVHFIKKLARKMASKQDLQQAFRGGGVTSRTQPRLSFERSDLDDDEDDCPLSLFTKTPRPSSDLRRPVIKLPSSVSTHPATRQPAMTHARNKESEQIEFLTSIGPFCTDEEERMWRKYRRDKARRASAGVLPVDWQTPKGMEVRDLCLDATEEGSRALSKIGIRDDRECFVWPSCPSSADMSSFLAPAVPMLPKTIQTVDVGYKVTILPSRSSQFDRPPSVIATSSTLVVSDKGARRAKSCDALSNTYKSKMTSREAATRLSTYRFGVQGRRTDPAPPARTPSPPPPPLPKSPKASIPDAALHTTVSYQTSEATSSTSTIDAVRSDASPADQVAQQSFSGYPESLLRSYERTHDSTDVSRDLQGLHMPRRPINSVVSDSFAYDTSSSTNPSPARQRARQASETESLQKCFDSVTPTAQHGFEAQLAHPTREATETETDMDDIGHHPITPRASFIDFAPFPSPLSIHPLAFLGDDAFATSTPLRPILRTSPSPPRPSSPANAPSEEATSYDEHHETSPSMLSECSFGDAYFGVATVATTTLPRILELALQTPLPISPLEVSFQPVSPPDQLSDAGKLEWHKLSEELGRPSSARPPTVLFDTKPNLLAHETPTASEKSLELFRARLRAALSPVQRSFDTLSPDQSWQDTSGLSLAPPVELKDRFAGSPLNRRKTPRYLPARRLSGESLRLTQSSNGEFTRHAESKIPAY